MTNRIDYIQIATKLDYSAVSEKLEQMTAAEPPKTRKRVGFLLGPLTAKLRELHAKGWTYEQLAKELSNMGLPVKPAILQRHLSSRKKRGPKTIEALPIV